MNLKTNNYAVRIFSPVFILILIFISGLKPDVTGAEVKSEGKIYRISVSKIMIRKGPSIDTPVIGSLSRGTLFYSIKNEHYKKYKDKIDGIDGEWIKVSIEHTGFLSAGYIFSGYLQDVTSEYTIEILQTPDCYCSSENSHKLRCIYDSTYDPAVKERDFLLNNIQRVTHYTVNCNDVSTINGYKNYNGIKYKYRNSEHSWIIISDNKSGLPVQIFYSQTPYECDE